MTQQYWIPDAQVFFVSHSTMHQQAISAHLNQYQHA
jgi:hypothetical protein